MHETPVITATRPDEDIAADIASLIRSYPPLFQARHWIAYTVEGGIVTVNGHIKSPIAQRVLVDNLPTIPGVTELDASAVYNDEALRRAVGQVLPHGLWASLDFGAVLIEGTLPAGSKVDAIVADVSAIPGVRHVETRVTS